MWVQQSSANARPREYFDVSSINLSHRDAAKELSARAGSSGSSVTTGHRLSSDAPWMTTSR